MKVVFAHTDFRIYWPARLKALHESLERKGIELYVVEISGEGGLYEFARENNQNLKWWYCIFPGRRMEEIPSPLANKALRKKLNDLQPDIIFAGSIAFPSGAAAARWAIANRKKVIMFDNARLIDVPRRWYINLIKKALYSTIDAVFCPSPQWNKTFNYFGFKDEQIFYGLNAINNSFWQDDSVSVDMDKRFFLAVGRQILKKNFLTLLKAYKLYSKVSNNPADLILVGNGNRRKVLEDYVLKNTLTKVTFLSFSSQENLRELYKEAICFILPSKIGETWGNVVNEAMATGIPVLVSDQVGCSSTLVRDGINGYVFSPDDYQYLSELLLKIELIPETDRKNMGQNSLKIINEWGLERFCQGAFDAIMYVNSIEFRMPSIISLSLVRFWKGRYRPV